ncbi:MAG: Wzz/FepE/Etk N-terminal domain-containing protein [Candidatus Bipolaricaulota bacterium]
MEEHEVDLRDYIRVLWRQKWVVIATFAAAVITALAISYAMPKQYQAETSLLISPPLAQDVGGQVTGTVYSPETYKRLALAGDLLQETLHHVYPDGQGPTVTALRQRMTLEVEQTTAKDFPGRFPLLLRLTIRGSNPDELPRLAEAWAAAFVRHNTELFLSRTAQSYEYVSRSLTEVERELLAREEERRIFQQENPEEVLSAEAQALRAQYEGAAAALATQERELAHGEARLVSLQKALADEPQHFTLERSLSNDALWNFLGTRPTPQQLAAAADVTLHEQVVNDAYVTLRREVATLQANVEALRAAVAYLRAEVANTRGAFEERQAHLIGVQTHNAQLDRAIAAVQAAYTSLAGKLQEARIARTETPNPIRVVEAPLRPTVPIGPNKSMNVAVAGVLGLFVGVLLAFLSHYLRADRTGLPKEEGSPLPHREQSK